VFSLQFSRFHVASLLNASFHTVSDSQREVVCDAAEQLQDRSKLLSNSVSVKDESATLAKKAFNSFSQSAQKRPFMNTPPLAYLLSRAHAAATQDQLSESVANASNVQLRSRSGGQGVSKRRASVSSSHQLIQMTAHSYISLPSKKMHRL
jgi:hypothetical protein